ncbi:MAG: pyruvate-flavodoxin oxidoreductase [Chloroflexota bacterium]|nr:pyruvate:ferredoxin (flavodoxin) oxidoreductase [Chloroflexota bacterium]NOG65753.1 pyruvate:ferredoxin (flavodoxin) oxidoreductase [Chloroflexota bacterium]GIK67067.1 MAG: pyruvate-flavodoxin oxidoreductase [Chloroflexota bacterium]
MTERQVSTLDANEAVARVAYALSEVIAIYPITPSSAMGEWVDEWAAHQQPNLWCTIPQVVEMQSEGGAAGAIHGALQAGALATTFTASQGLLLMIPNMYKIAGELTATVFHIAARSLAAQALSIFGDHSDVMAVRQTGWALLNSASVQEAHDMALIAHASTLAAHIPFIHFFDGFRTSHEIAKIELLGDDDLKAMINEELITQHRNRALTPDKPVVRGTAHNPDVYFQGRETVNSFYANCPDIVQDAMDKFAKLTGRQYHLFDYHGAPDAERVVVLMGSGAEATHETVDYLVAKGEKVGVLKVRLYRPFDMRRFVAALPKTVKFIAVLDRTKEPGSGGEPLYLDCVNALHEEWVNGPMPKIVGGRYGLSSKEFTPAMVKAVFDNLKQAKPKNHFTVGINDDVTFTSLDYDKEFSIEPDSVVRAVFYGLGSDGTVGANKNSIKIIGENTDFYAQGYFVLDSKKSGSTTTSHLRFGPNPIRSTYLISKANFIGCHHPNFLEQYDILTDMLPGGTFLLNTYWGPDEIWDHLPTMVQTQLIEKHVKLYVIDANKVAKEAGLPGRINTVMQVCFFALAGVLPRDESIAAIKHAIEKTYAKKGEYVVEVNLAAVDRTLENLFEVQIPNKITSDIGLRSNVAAGAPAFVQNVIGAMIARRGDDIPVSAMPIDGTFPSGTSQFEKRNLAQEIPVWDPEVCIQCGKCAMVCPHAVIRIKVFDPATAGAAPETFKAVPARDNEFAGMSYNIQVSPEDCTGCKICVDVCPAKNKSAAGLKALNMEAQPPILEQERKNWDYFLTIPELDRRLIKVSSIRQQQIQQPLFEFSGACSGCGETPYLKLISQLFGDRTVVANATGCSSIYGGNLPTTPWAHNSDGRGPAWSNSLFEDNAEFGLGMRVALDKQTEYARELVAKMSAEVGDELVSTILQNPQRDEAAIYEQRQNVALLKERLLKARNPEAPRLLDVADMLVRKDVWIVGGDGWAYDIGFGGLDHVLASGRNVNILVMDTEVYSNTGGQMSKSTPRGAVAKFASGGKPGAKKDLGMIAMSYGSVYVARVALGAKDEQTLKAFLEAEAYDGPSLIIAYSHCIAHGIEMSTALKNQKAAVDTGQWLLYRYNPERALNNENPLVLDSRAPKVPVKEYLRMENRFRMLELSNPEVSRQLFDMAQEDVHQRWALYEYLASRDYSQNGNGSH